MLEQNIKVWGLMLSDRQRVFFAIFCQNLTRFSKVLGLTSACDQELWQKHFFDSLKSLPYLINKGHGKILDIGSGGGFPGMCLAIMMPSSQFTLCESSRKKAGFLLSTMYLMGIKNVKICCCSYQEIKEVFDLCISRATLRILPKNIKKILRLAPTILCYKGKKIHTDHDLQRLKARGISARIDVLSDSFFPFERTFLWIGKV